MLQNHFHILVRIRSELEIKESFPDKIDVEIKNRIGHQFSNTFNSYSQAINKRFGRTGKLFELPFRRKEILTKQQLLNCILYINKNPAKHKIAEDIFTYPYSSVNDIFSINNSFVESSKILNLFNGEDDFKIALENYIV